MLHPLIRQAEHTIQDYDDESDASSESSSEYEYYNNSDLEEDLIENDSNPANNFTTTTTSKPKDIKLIDLNESINKTNSKIPTKRSRSFMSSRSLSNQPKIANSAFSNTAVTQATSQPLTNLHAPPLYAVGSIPIYNPYMMNPMINPYFTGYYPNGMYPIPPTNLQSFNSVGGISPNNAQPSNYNLANAPQLDTPTPNANLATSNLINVNPVNGVHENSVPMCPCFGLMHPNQMNPFNFYPNPPASLHSSNNFASFVGQPEKQPSITHQPNSNLHPSFNPASNSINGLAINPNSQLAPNSASNAVNGLASNSNSQLAPNPASNSVNNLANISNTASSFGANANPAISGPVRTNANSLATNSSRLVAASLPSKLITSATVLSSNSTTISTTTTFITTPTTPKRTVIWTAPTQLPWTSPFKDWYTNTPPPFTIGPNDN